MNDLNPDPLQDTFEVEISDLAADQADEPDEPAPATRRVGPTRLSPRARARRVALAVVILASQPAARSQVVGFVQQFIPTPTPTLAPGADRFYIATDVPWTTVALDGQPIALPRIGVDAPLHLARGHHLLLWAAAPFQPQQCSLDIPPTPSSSCPVIDQVRQSASGPPVAVIALRESLDTLPASQQQALIQTTQAALSGFSDTVQPGEPYLIETGSPVPNVFGDGISRQPLRATLQLPLDTDPLSDTCLLNPRDSQTTHCSISGQDCDRFCTIPWQARQADTTADRPAWQTIAVIDPPSWDYTTEDGLNSMQNQPLCSCGAGTREALVLLGISWDGLAWHVQPLFGPNQGSPLVVGDTQIAADPACLVAEDIFPEEIQTYTQLHFIAGPNPAAGMPARSDPCRAARHASGWRASRAVSDALWRTGRCQRPRAPAQPAVAAGRCLRAADRAPACCPSRRADPRTLRPPVPPFPAAKRRASVRATRAAVVMQG